MEGDSATTENENDQITMKHCYSYTSTGESRETEVPINYAAHDAKNGFGKVENRGEESRIEHPVNDVDELDRTRHLQAQIRARGDMDD